MVIEVVGREVRFMDQPLQANARYGLEERFQPSSRFTVVLVGKDGTAKLREKRAVSSDDLFALIDAMPMRQREMREQREE